MKVGTKLTLIITAAMLLISLSFYAMQRYSRDRLLESITLKRVQQAEYTVRNLEEQDTRMLAAVLDVVLKDQGFKELFLSGDRERLYSYGRPLFEELKGKYGITHFYFHLPNGINFLRLHEKEIYGDKIERVTFKRAQSSKQFTSGIELGKTAFALRVVAPYYDRGELIGYVELGQEIDHFLKTLKGNTNDEFVTAAEKEYLNREDWISVRRVAGLPDNWDELGEHVWFNWTTLSPLTEGCFTEGNIARVEKGESLFKDFQGRKKGFACGGFPLNDVEGRPVGAVLTMIDIRDQIAMARKSDLNIVIVFSLLFILGTVLLSLSIKGMITSPIERLAEAAKVIADGDMSHRMEVGTGDEIGKLAGIMNDMAARLQIAHSSLESQVEIRTEELRGANEELILANEELQSACSQSEILTAELEESSESLSRANDDLKGMDRLKTEFLQTISHELRSPLTPVLGYLEMLRDGDAGELDPKQKEIVEEMHVCGKNMQLLVDELVEAASIQAGKLYLEFEEVDICQVLRGSINGIRKYADTNRTELEVRIPYCPMPVEGDRRRLMEIFTHIIRNAVKFNHEGGKVLVTASATDKGTEVAVSDTGIGIPKERLERIFETFYQAESSPTKRYEGVGLGLYLVKRLVDVHNGKITVKSEVGVGTTFSVFIPRKRSMGTIIGDK